MSSNKLTDTKIKALKKVGKYSDGGGLYISYRKRLQALEAEVPIWGERKGFIPRDISTHNLG